MKSRSKLNGSIQVNTTKSNWQTVTNPACIIIMYHLNITTNIWIIWSETQTILFQIKEKSYCSKKKMKVSVCNPFISLVLSQDRRLKADPNPFLNSGLHAISVPHHLTLSYFGDNHIGLRCSNLTMFDSEFRIIFSSSQHIGCWIPRPLWDHVCNELGGGLESPPLEIMFPT